MASPATRQLRRRTTEEDPSPSEDSHPSIPDVPMQNETDANIRRSGRKRTGKSALELLGVTPRKGLEISISHNHTPRNTRRENNQNGQKGTNVSPQASSLGTPKGVSKVQTRAEMDASKKLIPVNTDQSEAKKDTRATKKYVILKRPETETADRTTEKSGKTEVTESSIATELIAKLTESSKSVAKEKNSIKTAQENNAYSSKSDKMDEGDVAESEVRSEGNIAKTRSKRTATSAQNTSAAKKSKPEISSEKERNEKQVAEVHSIFKSVYGGEETNEGEKQTEEEYGDPIKEGEIVTVEAFVESIESQVDEKMEKLSTVATPSTVPNPSTVATSSMVAIPSTSNETLTETTPTTTTIEITPKQMISIPASRKSATSKRKKIVKAVIVTPSGEKKEVKLGPHISTLKALEHILSGTNLANLDDVAQLAEDVNKQIEETIEKDDTAEESTGQSNTELPPEENPEIQEEPTTSEQTIILEPIQADDPASQVTVIENEAANGEEEDQGKENARIAIQAMTQLANISNPHESFTIELEADSIDAEWLEQQGIQVLPLDNDDKLWQRQLVGMKDKTVVTSTAGMRAKPEKHVVASYDLEKMVNDLKPDDTIENHTYTVQIGNASQMKCKHCDLPIHDRHDFRRHMTSHKEVSYKPWKCPICEYRAAVRAQIARHVNIHGELKPYVCKECGKGFNFKQKLVQHLKYHLDIRDKPCPYCHLAFHEHKTLKNHVRKIHGEHLSLDCTEPTSPPSKSSRNKGGNDALVGGLADGTESDSQNVDEESLKKDTNKNVLIAGATKIVEIRPTPEGEEVIEHPPVTEEDPERHQQQGLSEPTSENVPQNVLDARKRMRRTSILYGTRKTSLYTQQYKMGLVPNADRNHVPPPSSDGSKSYPGVLDPATINELGGGEEKEEEEGSRYTSHLHTQEVIDNYCTVTEVEEGMQLFQCKSCHLEPFSSRTVFFHHLEQKHPELKPWKCDQCGYQCRMRTSLIVHLKLHAGVKDYHCNLCGKSFAFKQKLKIHMKHHLNLREFSCEICQKSFNEKNDLTKHVRKVHLAERDCICSVCNKGFKDQCQLRRHMDSHNDDPTKYRCQHCNKFYRSKVSLAQHMKSHTCMFHCEICDKDFGSYSGFMAHKVMHDESFEGYECTMCKKVLHTKGSLTRHIAVAHSNERPFPCTLCNKRFKTKKDHKNHSIVHTHERNFSCEHCDFTSKRLESLRVHQRRHAEVKPFQCGMCGKEYTQKHALETHLRHHTGTMEASCPICAREFFTRYQLETHIRRKHPTSKEGLASLGEQPVTVFMCEECNAVFMTQDSLAVHILAEHMKQGWTSGVTHAGTNLLDNGNQGPTSGTLEEEGIANTVEIITEAEASTGGILEANPNHSLSFNEQTIELVPITDPETKKQRFVSLIRPVDMRDVAPQAHEFNEGVIVDSVVSQSQIEEELVGQEVMGQEVVGEESKLEIIGHAHAGAGDNYVTISDPTTNQEMLVAMPHANFESLLAATEIESQNISAYIDASGEGYITVRTNENGDIIQEAAGQFVIEEGEGGEQRVLAITSGEDAESGNYEGVVETVEVSIESESVTI